jgi:uncharacterized membrane protein
LFLGLSPIGFNFVPITISLCALVLVLAVIGLVRKNRELGQLNMQIPEQISS